MPFCLSLFSSTEQTITFWLSKRYDSILGRKMSRQFEVWTEDSSRDGERLFKWVDVKTSKPHSVRGVKTFGNSCSQEVSLMMPQENLSKHLFFSYVGTEIPNTLICFNN